LIDAGFGQFHSHPQLDLVQNMVELVIAGALLEAGGNRFQAQKRCGFEAPRKERELELLERIQRPAPVLDRAAPPLCSDPLCPAAQ
jgi:hypothetical protein